jgi:hypothetical protein
MRSVVRGIEPFDQQAEALGLALGVELAGPIRAQLVKKRVMLVIAHHRLDDAAIEEHQKVPAMPHGVPFAPELDHHCMPQ